MEDFPDSRKPQSKTSKELLSDFVKCYNLLDEDLDTLRFHLENQIDLNKYLDDLNKLIALGELGPLEKHYRFQQLKLNNDNGLDVAEIEPANVETINTDTDLEILKYRQARQDVLQHNNISILHLRPSSLKDLLSTTVRQPELYALRFRLENILDYLWNHTEISDYNLQDFEIKHGLENLSIIKQQNSQPSSLSPPPASKDSYDNFRLGSLYFHPDLKIDLGHISTFDLRRSTICMINLTNKKFKAQLEQKLFRAHLEHFIDNKQFRSLQNYYDLNSIEVDYKKYQSHIEIDVDLMSYFDR